MTGRWMVLGLVVLVAAGWLFWLATEDEPSATGTSERDTGRGEARDLEMPIQLAGRAEDDVSAGEKGQERQPEATPPTFPLEVGLYLVDVEPHPVRVWLRDGAGVVRERVVDAGTTADFGEVAEGSLLAWAQGTGAAAIARGRSLRGLEGKPWRFEWVFLFPAGPLEGSVVDTATGRGIEGATVRFQGLASGASSPAWRTAADDAGRFRLEAVPLVSCGRNGPKIRRPGLVVIAPGYGQRRVLLTWDDVKAGGPLRIAMEAGGAAAGHVTDHAGDPIADATVLALPVLGGRVGPIRGSLPPRLPIEIASGRTVVLRQSGDDFHPFPMQQTLGIGATLPHPLATRTGADGSYEIEGLTLGMPWRIVADIPNRPLSDTRDVLPTADDPLATADLRVGRFGRLRLVLADAEGRGIEAARAFHVGLEQKTYGERSGLYETRTLDPEEGAEDVGAIRILDPCPAGPVRVVLRAPGYLTRDLRLDVAPAVETRHEVTMDRGLTIQGLAEQPDGQPLYYAFVRAIPEVPLLHHTFFQDGYEVRTGQDGLFRFAGQPPGRYRLEVRHFMHRSAALSVVLEDVDLEVNLRVLELHEVELRFETSDGAELPDMIWVKQVGENVDAVDQGLRFDRLRGGVRTREMGEIVQLEGGRGTLRFWDGQRYVIVAHEGYAPFIRRIDPEHDKEIAVRLEKGRPLEGVVVDPDGRPLAGAVVAPAQAFFTCDHRVQTDAEGRFTIPDMGPGPYELYAWARGFPEHVFPVNAPPAGDLVRLVLPRGVRVAGTVWAKPGRPAPTRTIVTIHRGGKGERFERIRTVGTDVRGEFEVALDRGRYLLEAKHEGRSARTTITVAEKSDARVELTLAARDGDGGDDR